VLINNNISICSTTETLETEENLEETVQKKFQEKSRTCRINCDFQRERRLEWDL
jgi:hypothetical protein